MTLTNFSSWINNVSINAFNCFKRQLVILQGSEQWANSLLKKIDSYPFVEEEKDKQTKRWYIYSDNLKRGNVNKQTYRNQLGTESHFVVFYSEELNVDALAALSGTLVAGGVLFIVLPNKIEDSSFFKNSFFNQRLANKIFNDSTFKIIKEVDSSRLNIENSFIPKSVTHPTVFKKYPIAMNCVTEEQFIAVKHIIQVVKGHRNRPLILTADRGRGKSSALAIACAHLLDNTKSELRIAITATHRKSLDVFFMQLAKSLAQKNKTRMDANQLEHKNGYVQFIAVDELIKTKTVFNLVLVDEAASIPLYFLNQLLAKHHRMVFASTVHGYEGAGRSFTLKFQKHVVQKYPEGKTLNISQPIRWAENDPVETFIYELCLLNAEVPPLPENFSLPQLLSSNINEQRTLEFEQVSTEALMLNELLLEQVFAVLVTAHYQTSPNDLRLLLDNNNITLVTLSYKKQLLGVALLLKEGSNANEQLKGLIQTNQRRLKDQFIPQSLLTHCGEESSFNYSYLRVMRIAIVPELQEKGLGSVFLSRIEEYAKQTKVDFVGTSFGANKSLLNFWQKQDYKIARIGFTKDKASGEHSALLLKVINQQHSEYLDKIENSFYQSFDYLLAEQYKELMPDLVWQIMTYCPLSSLPILNNSDLKAIEDFFTKKRQYSVCVYHLHKWLQHQMIMPFDPAMAPIISKIFQRKEISNLAESYGFTGKKAFNNHLIQFTQSYYQKQSK
ncbi:GNAT family N-acetyltransferase [Colwellia sp. RE-S-Sl-9]